MEIELGEITTCQMTLAAIAAYPGECCGILLGKTSESGEVEILETREAHNQIQGAQKSAHFRVDPLFLYQVEREIEGSGIEVIGFYHSHPDCAAVPSDEDYENMVPGLIYVILSVTKDGVKDIRSYKKDINY
ncbi:MAG: M67 family metallopeptidase [Fibrobacter sp.]|uniref:M67 family metallopeptidase n=1 Tax=Fibrobacter sp. TaxID=35828 RepID=UPI0025B7D113|nr:M67 family metallopeptidase [Fibrobacter sp.]MBR4785531.1 M67 family metallopeptidase [Fibrobacter sp.]